ncbi:S-adenosyl-L-methionine-dependent methyltransferase [Punctularia strigosozonata HHB-11173 SS5]|uniref:S-adenosyl-L-methionine-dependent methyltransferase n=1 Tax=Punctularia strigosozonata (strain HHB-11173) TaxID=741275 RepID=UPI0004417DA8|nr:S-adenosyl-L-methionine-dependent methyltransferase [Punctularia strigosozonata HHB-11173 SS5]EIN12301.1 S-adenosyl-L-methionine-dependent methyltransferase [Punctularia strigosozonata HHB-11173 SS5]
MVRRAAKEMEDGGWKGVKVEKMDAQNLTYPDDHWTHVTCSFGAMMMPEPDRFFEGAHRTLLPGGQLGFTVWKAIGWAPLIPAAVKRARPSDPLSHSPFAAWAHGWERAEFVQTLLARHGFVDVHMKEMGATLQLPSLEFLRTKVLGRISDELRKDWSEEEKAKWADAVDEAAREKGAVGEDGGVMLQQVA